jgi:hypothetical protein
LGVARIWGFSAHAVAAARSDGPGAATSEAEVTNISKHGFWLLVDGHEVFLPFEDFPWFKRAPVEAILRLERAAPDHFHWPELDIDLSRRGFPERRIAVHSSH